MKITLNDVTNIDALSVINDNFDKIEQELQNKVLYRNNPSGEPNSISNDIDMNGNDLLNVGDVVSVNGRWATINEVEDIKDQVEADAATVAADKALTLGYRNTAQTAATDAQTAYDNFDDRYLGSKSADPSIDNDGNALLTGALYYRTSGTPIMRVYNGSAWQDVGSITSTTTTSIDPSLYPSQAEAEVGANNALVMTPLRVKQAIDKQVKEGFSSTGAIVLPGNASTALQAAPKQQVESIVTDAVANRMQYTLTSSKPTTSGTSVDFSPADGTAIPSWAKRITIAAQDVATNGGSQVLIQVGTSSGVASSGYAGGNLYYLGGSSGAHEPLSSGFRIFIGGASIFRFGTLTLNRLTGNKWMATGQFAHSFGFAWVSGVKVLTDVIDRIRITTVNGTDSFTQGEVSLLIEG